MPSYREAFGSWLKHADLQGHDARVVIEKVGYEDVKGDKGVERRLVARFAGKSKALILNVTNSESIGTITGTEDYTKWSGARVVLYPAKTTFGSKTDVDCIRVKAPSPPPSPRPMVTTPAPTEFSSDEQAEHRDALGNW